MASQTPSTRKSSLASTIHSSDEPSEDTPLLLKREQSRVSVLWNRSTVYRVLLTSFIVSLSFGVTQVPIVYVFGVMTCEEYYRHHPLPPLGTPAWDRRCMVPAIHASTARSVALMGTSTTFFGVINLFFTGWTMKAMGIKRALQLTVFCPALRLAIQNVGVEIGADLGILIMQLSQILTVVGGPVGYLLALNSMAAEVVEPAERTATLGRLSGCGMFGTALGFLAGGLIGDWFGIAWPFRVTLGLFLLSSLYVQLCLPTIHNKSAEGRAAKSLTSFFDPIKVFAPTRWILTSGMVRKEWGVLLLGAGTFLGVLATSYIPTLLQMYSTDVFDFGTSENGLLISINSMIRGLFLTLVFPVIISSGRRWLDNRTQAANSDKVSGTESGIPDLPTAPNQLAADQQATYEAPTEPIEPPKPSDRPDAQETFHFDLLFTKYSLIADGLLTGLATFTKQGYQMYIIAVILPLASGTGPAAKGTILQMCPPAQRQDALSAISLVELLARLMSTSVFGLIFSAFAELECVNLTFAVNAGIAVVGFAVLMFARFPPEGAERWVEEDVEPDAGDER